MATKRKTRKSHPTWTDLKPKLAGFDRAGLIGLLKDLYSFSKDNQAFLHARFGVGEDTLKPYKETISRWVCPDIPDQDYSVSKAKKAISDYRKAIGRPEGIAELTLFYCEECISFLNFCGVDDEGYYHALEVAFEQACEAIRGIMAICKRKSNKYRVSVTSLEFAGKAPKGTEWIEAYKAWISGGW